MCKYCNWAFSDGWDQLLQYDPVYQQSHTGTPDQRPTHGFHSSWDELSDELRG